MIAVSIITGFLGSGKTTLLSRLLRDPSMGRAAVIINEFGAVGIDHDLVATSNENFVQLTTGCLCCKIRSDLVETLTDLAARRAAGTVPCFDQVVIETTGLADPAPILHALITAPDLIGTYALDTIIATADAVNGLHTLDHHEQSVRQIAVADSIVITKTDMRQARTSELQRRLVTVNPRAAVFCAVQGAIGADVLFAKGDLVPNVRLPWASRLAAATIQDDRGGQNHDHNHGITSFCLVRETPVCAAALALLLEALADNCGSSLLRVKGIVHVFEVPNRPAVIHGVQHVFHPLAWLERWPSDDLRTRIVFIVRDIPEEWVRNLLDVLDEEVIDESARQAIEVGGARSGLSTQSGSHKLAI